MVFLFFWFVCLKLLNLWVLCYITKCNYQIRVSDGPIWSGLKESLQIINSIRGTPLVVQWLKL